MNIFIYLFILSFSYDLPIISLYSKWATIKASDLTGFCLIFLWTMSFVFRRYKIEVPFLKQLRWYVLVCIITSIPTIIFMSMERGDTLAWEYSGYWIFRLIEYTLFYIIGYEFSVNREKAYKFLIAFWLGGIFVGLFGLLQHYGYAPLEWGVFVLTPKAITSTLSWHHGHLGAYMLVIFFLTLGLFMHATKRSFKFIFALSLLLFIYVEMLTLRRSTWFGLVGGLLLWTVFIKARLNRRIKTYIIAALLVVSILTSFMSSEHSMERLELLYPTTQMEPSSAVSTRVNIMDFFIVTFRDNLSALIWGLGYMSSPMRYEYSGAHNQFLDVLHDSGIIGLIVFLWLLYSMLKILRNLSNSSDNWQPIYYASFFGLLGLIGSSMTGGFFSVSHVFGSFLGFYLTLLGVILGSSHRIAKPIKNFKKRPPVGFGSR